MILYLIQVYLNAQTFITNQVIVHESVGKLLINLIND